jgi:hypothetical protein
MRRLGPPTEALVGDLLEEYRQGRSRLWYWREVLVAVSVAQSRAVGRMTQSLTAGWTVEIFPRRLIGTGVFFILFGALLAAESAFWRFVGNMTLWVPVAAMSLVVTVKMIRRREVALYRPADALPARLRRWVRDEADQDRQ